MMVVWVLIITLCGPRGCSPAVVDNIADHPACEALKKTLDVSGFGMTTCVPVRKAVIK
jgi:hypothetical protein